MTFDSILNRGEFFSNHYLEAVISGDLGDLRSQWDDAEAAHKDTARSRLRSLAKQYFALRADASEASGQSRAPAVRALNSAVLSALGFTVERQTVEFSRTTEETLTVPVASTVETGSGLLLVALDAGLADDIDDLFDSGLTEEGLDAPAALLEPVLRSSDKKAVRGAGDAIGEIFATDEPPRWVVVAAGHMVLLAERARWAEGRFLTVDLDIALERNDTKKGGELETIAALFSTDAIVPDDGQSVIDDLAEKSTKHAVGVSKELREGIRHSIEILANEVIEQRYAKTSEQHKKRFAGDEVDAKELTRQCLRYLYRLLVLLYAESRPELGIVPVDDEVYRAGYSLDRLRELVLVDLENDEARNGSHLHESLSGLFELVNSGYHAEHAEQALDLFGTDELDDLSYEDYLQFPGLDAQLFSTESTSLLDGVTLRNEAIQRVLRLLMLSPEGKGKKASRGFISYAQLGINQLGAVYEGLMAYTGFFAKEDLYEVAKDGDPSDGTWVLPVDDADEYPDEVFVKRTDPLTGQEERILHPTGSFVFRLSGRDRQRSASYYTPEVLTRCVVKHALAELLGMDDYAPEHGSSGITEARQILDLTICEPALGSGAFLNEAINQLSAVYLQRRQAELGETLDPERYNRELQKVKAHFALHQSYGVDLNPTAVELAEVSLWLNAMHPGLKAPWFGLQLRAGNSLVGCRRATWRTNQLKAKPWNETKKDKLQPPVDRPLAESLESDEIHHFLLPGHGWAAVADRREAKEFREQRANGLKEWRNTIIGAPTAKDADRLTALAAGVERLWVSATERIRLVQRDLRRPIQVWGAEPLTTKPPVSREKAIEALINRDTALGRLRTVMDAWIGLWFWELDSEVALPTWNQWLTVLEALVDPDAAVGATGQLDMFDDLAALLEADERRSDGQRTVSKLTDQHPWLGVAVDLARREGAWHWELEFAPQFAAEGFDLQVGNPPWVRLDWKDDLVLAELDPWWGVINRASAAAADRRRTATLEEPAALDGYLQELASAEGLTESIGSPTLRPLLAGLRDNLYMTFLDTAWRNARDVGAVGLLHPEGHLTDPKAGALRRAGYHRLRRTFLFPESRRWFEDLVGQTTSHSVNVYGDVTERPQFLLMAHVPSTDVIDGSLVHDGSGPIPGIQHEEGGADERPHKARVLTVTAEVLADWVLLFDDPSTSSYEARLLRPLTTHDLHALEVLARSKSRLGDVVDYWAQGWNETNAKADETIHWETGEPSGWDDVIFQGAHFGPANLFDRNPNPGCKHQNDYAERDLESLTPRVVPRTNYQRSCSRDEYESRLEHWDGRPTCDYWRVMWRKLTQSSSERSFHPVLLPPGPAHVEGCRSLAARDLKALALHCGLLSGLPTDYLVKVSGIGSLHTGAIAKLPAALENGLADATRLRALRLNALTADYGPLWDELFDPVWVQESWTLPHATVKLGDIGPEWTMATPLRRDVDRRQALVEIDALAALMLGLTVEQLCAMYRTQFPVLRKYEYAMAFDTEGRKICKHHQSAGYRQSQLQQQAKDGELPSEWKSIWKLYEQWEEDPDSVDWLGHFHPPFYRPDREAEMTAAYNEFQRRLDAGEYGADDA